MTIKTFLHFGQNKAGSSFIQKTLNNSSDELNKENYYYPTHDLNKNSISGGHQLLLDDHKSLKKIIDHVKKTKKNLILSSEYFFVQREKFKKLVDLLPGEKHFIGFFRHPLEHFNSNYSQGVKNKFEFEPYCAGFDKFNYQINLRLLLSLMEYSDKHHVSVQSYDKCLNNKNNILETFLEQIHLPKGFLAADDKVNSSYSIGCSALKKITNRIYHSLNEKGAGEYKNDIHKLGIILQEISDNSSTATLDLSSMLTEDQRKNQDLQLEKFNKEMQENNLEELNERYRGADKIKFSRLFLINDIEHTLEFLQKIDIQLFRRLRSYLKDAYKGLLEMDKFRPEFFIRRKNLTDLLFEEMIVFKSFGLECSEFKAKIDRVNAFTLSSKNKEISLNNIREKGYFNALHEHMLKN